MKTLFILALLCITASNVFAQLEPCSQAYECQQQPFQWQQQLNPCRQFLIQQCSPMVQPFMRSLMFQQSTCQMMRQQCCQQLSQMMPQNRCQAICSLAHAFTQQQWFGFYQPQQSLPEAVMMVQSIPSMCNVYVPPYCTTSCSMSTATCSGGSCY